MAKALMAYQAILPAQLASPQPAVLSLLATPGAAVKFRLRQAQTLARLLTLRVAGKFPLRHSLVLLPGALSRTELRVTALATMASLLMAVTLTTLMARSAFRQVRPFRRPAHSFSLLQRLLQRFQAFRHQAGLSGQLAFQSHHQQVLRQLDTQRVAVKHQLLATQTLRRQPILQRQVQRALLRNRLHRHQQTLQRQVQQVLLRSQLLVLQGRKYLRALSMLMGNPLSVQRAPRYVLQQSLLVQRQRLPQLAIVLALALLASRLRQRLASWGVLIVAGLRLLLPRQMLSRLGATQHQAPLTLKRNLLARLMCHGFRCLLTLKHGMSKLLALSPGAIKPQAAQHGRRKWLAMNLGAHSLHQVKLGHL